MVIVRRTWKYLLQENISIFSPCLKWFEGGIQTYKLKKLGLKTKYCPIAVFFILRHIFDFRYLKYLKMDLTIFLTIIWWLCALGVIIDKELPLCICVEHDFMVSTKWMVIGHRIWKYLSEANISIFNPFLKK